MTLLSSLKLLRTGLAGCGDIGSASVAAASGADFMIEGTLLHKHAGQPGSAEWKWENLGAIESRATGSVIDFIVPGSRVGIEPGKPFRIWCSTTNATWQPVDWIRSPSTGFPTSNPYSSVNSLDLPQQ